MLVIEELTSEAELKSLIVKQGPELLTKLKNELGPLETEYLKARRRSAIGILFLVGGFLIASLPSIISIIIGFLLVYLGLKYIIISQSVISQFNRKVDGILFYKVFALFRVSGTTFDQPIVGNPDTLYTGFNRASLRNFLNAFKVKKGPVEEEVLNWLDNSELITEDHNHNHVDTVMKLQVGDTPITVAEFDIEHVTGSGKNKSTKQIFHGYFASLELKRELAGKTFTSTEGDRAGFGQITFWNKSSADVPKETILEWNEFENMLHVATTNETEARYILTPNFMQDLYDWWKEQKTNIRIAFIKNRMYVLFPDDKIRLGHGITGDLTEESLVEYIYTIARPLWHILRLTGKVKL